VHRLSRSAPDLQGNTYQIAGKTFCAEIELCLSAACFLIIFVPGAY